MSYLIITGQEVIVYDTGIRQLSPYIDIDIADTLTSSGSGGEKQILSNVFQQISYQDPQPKNMVLLYLQNYVLTENTKHLVMCTSFNLSYIQQIMIYNELVRINVRISFIPIANYFFKRTESYFRTNIPIFSVFIDSDQIFLYSSYNEIKYYNLDEQQNMLTKMYAYERDDDVLKRTYIIFNMYDDIRNQIQRLQSRVIVNVCMANYTDIQIAQDFNKYLFSQMKDVIVGANFIYFHKDHFIQLIKDGQMQLFLHQKQEIYYCGQKDNIQLRTGFHDNEIIHIVDNGLYYQIYNPVQLNYLIFNQYDAANQFPPAPINVKAYLSIDHCIKDYETLKNKQKYQKTYTYNMEQLFTTYLSRKDYNEIEDIIKHNHFGKFSPLNKASLIHRYLLKYTSMNDYIYGKYNEIIKKNEPCAVFDNIVIFQDIIQQTETYTSYYGIDIKNKQFISVLCFKKLRLNSICYNVDTTSNSYFLNFDSQITKENLSENQYNNATSRSLMNSQINKQIMHLIPSGIHINDIHVPLDVYLKAICSYEDKQIRIQLVHTILRAINQCKKRCFLFWSPRQILITGNYKIKFDQFNSYPCNLQEQISSFQNICYKYIFREYLSYENLIETSIIPPDDYLVKNFVLFQPSYAIGFEYELVIDTSQQYSDDNNQDRYQSMNIELHIKDNDTESANSEHSRWTQSYQEEFGCITKEYRLARNRLQPVQEVQNSSSTGIGNLSNHSPNIHQSASNINLIDNDYMSADESDVSVDNDVQPYSDDEDNAMVNFTKMIQDKKQNANIITLDSSQKSNKTQNDKNMIQMLEKLDRHQDGTKRKKAIRATPYIDDTQIRYDSVCDYNRPLYWKRKQLPQLMMSELLMQLLLAAPLFLSDEQKALTIDQIEQSVNSISNFFQIYIQRKGLPRNFYQGIELRTSSADQSDINRAQQSSSCAITKISGADIDVYVRKFRNILAHFKASIFVEDVEAKDGGALYRAFEQKTPGIFEIIYDAWLHYIQYDQ